MVAQERRRMEALQNGANREAERSANGNRGWPKSNEGCAMEIVKKTVRVDVDIDEALYTAKVEYQRKWGRLPEGLLLGPNAWVAFEEYVYSNARVRLDPKPGRAEFHGVKLYLMSRQGIDVMPDDSVAHCMALGTVETE
mgnify:CR=1 FL=1